MPIGRRTILRDLDNRSPASRIKTEYLSHPAIVWIAILEFSARNLNHRVPVRPHLDCPSECRQPIQSKIERCYGLAIFLYVSSRFPISDARDSSYRARPW